MFMAAVVALGTVSSGFKAMFAFVEGNASNIGLFLFFVIVIPPLLQNPKVFVG